MSNIFENYRPAPLSCLLPGHDGKEHKISDLELREKAHKLENSYNINHVNEEQQKRIENNLSTAMNDYVDKEIVSPEYAGI